MECHLFELLMRRYHDGEMEAVERASYEQHRASCAACRALDRRYAGVVRALEAVQRWEPSPDFNARVLERINVRQYRVSPLERAARALGRSWEVIPTSVKTAGALAAWLTIFIAAYGPFLDLVIRTLGKGVAVLSGSFTALRDIVLDSGLLRWNLSTLRNYELAGETLLRVARRMLAGVHPVEAALVLIALAAAAWLIARAAAAARKKGVTHVGIV
jgi:predicted anti-sigma-YlaC factor YlaD